MYEASCRCDVSQVTGWRQARPGLTRRDCEIRNWFTVLLIQPQPGEAESPSLPEHSPGTTAFRKEKQKTTAAVLARAFFFFFN